MADLVRKRMSQLPDGARIRTGVEFRADSVLVFKDPLAALDRQFKPYLRGFTAGAHAHEIAFCRAPGFHSSTSARSESYEELAAVASATMLRFLAPWLCSSAVVCISSVFMS